MHHPTATLRNLVETCASYGMTEVDIACLLDISPPTLRKHYRAELAVGHTRANAKVAEALFKAAIGDGPQAVTAAIFWCKARMGWRA